MSRELKFRAWDEKEKEMCYAFWLGFKGKPGSEYGDLPPEFLHCNAPAVDEFSSVILMQYTGIKDKKRTNEFPEGQPIFEGDIIKVGELHVVHIGDIRHLDKVMECTSRGIWLEVIGNIHQNPGLLK